MKEEIFKNQTYVLNNATSKKFWGHNQIASGIHQIK